MGPQAIRSDRLYLTHQAIIIACTIINACTCHNTQTHRQLMLRQALFHTHMHQHTRTHAHAHTQISTHRHTDDGSTGEVHPQRHRGRRCLSTPATSVTHIYSFPDLMKWDENELQHIHTVGISVFVEAVFLFPLFHCHACRCLLDYILLCHLTQLL